MVKLLFSGSPQLHVIRASLERIRGESQMCRWDKNSNLRLRQAPDGNKPKKDRSANQLGKILSGHWMYEISLVRATGWLSLSPQRKIQCE